MAGIHGIDAGRGVLGYRQLASLGTAVSCPFPRGGAVMFRPMAQGIRYRLDGEAPTASVGFAVAVGECVYFVGDLSKLSFIEIAGGAVLDIHVFE